MHELTQERFTARNVAIGFNPRRGDARIDLSSANRFGETREQLRLVMLDVTVKRGLTLNEDVVGIALREIQRIREGANAFAAAFRERPQPR